MSHKLTKLFDGDDSLFKDLLKNSKNYGEYGQKHLEKNLVNPIRRQIPLQKFVHSFLFN